MFDRLRIAAAIAAFSAVAAIAGTATPARADGSTFQNYVDPSGGRILTGTLGPQDSLASATAAMLRTLHAKLGARPIVGRVAQNTSDHTMAVFFHTSSLSGLSIVTAAPGAQASGAALFDTTARFPRTLGPMLKRLRSATDVSAGRSGGGSGGAVSPAEPLSQQQFADGTGSIGLPADWQLVRGGGGSVIARGPSGEIVAWNVDNMMWDPTNARGRNFYGSIGSSVAQGFLKRVTVLPANSDPVHAWTQSLIEGSKRAGRGTPQFTVETRRTISSTAAVVTGTGMTNVPIRFGANIFTLPPDPMGQWNTMSTYFVVPQSHVHDQLATAVAILESVKINFNAVSAQAAANRAVFQKQFEAMIANGAAQNAEREAGTQAFLASDREAQEGMHRQAVAVENLSLGRTVLVDTQTGGHGTLDDDLADALVQGDSRFQRVPANQLLRGVDY